MGAGNFASVLRRLFVHNRITMLTGQQREKINILFIENGISGGGSFESLYQIVTHLNPELFQPIVIFANETHYYQKLIQRHINAFVLCDPVYSVRTNIWLRRMLLRFNRVLERCFPFLAVYSDCLIHLPTIIAVSKMVKKYKIDVIHLNNQCVRDLFGVSVSRRTGVACISFLRSVRVSGINPHKIRFLNRHVGKFIANSNFTRKFWSGLGISPARISTLYNAIECDAPGPIDIRSEWRIPDKLKFIIGCVGNLSDSKGHDFLIAAFRRVLEGEPQSALVIVGEGERRRRLVKMTKDLGIEEKVVFTGYDSRAKQIIAGLDLLILPSCRETFGRTLLEAMSSKTPIIATRSGGIPEIIEHEHNGILVDYGDEDALSRQIIRLLRDKALAARLAENGYDVCKKRFSFDNHLKAIEEIYKSAGARQ